MRKLNRRVWVENEYVGVHVGLIKAADDLMLVDAPLLVDEAREWLDVVKAEGSPRYIAFLDNHPDRILGAVNYELPIIAHASTMEAMSALSDTFKGGAHPIGAEADQIKRAVGVQKTVPDLAFGDVMTIYLGDLEVIFMHRPGPRDGSMWILIPSIKTGFIGDFVTVSEPPYFGAGDIDQWLMGLDELRASPLSGYKLVSSRDGLIKRDDINSMARFLRKIPPRIKQFSGKDIDEEVAEKTAASLLKNFDVPVVYQELVTTRLISSFLDLRERQISSE